MSRIRLIGAAFFVLFAGLVGVSSDQRPKETKPPLTALQKRLEKEPLIVHEWGVFTIFNDVKYANANRAEEWGSLPEFFYRQFPKERLHWMPAGWDKPIIYFYTKHSGFRLKVTVTFAEGAPVVWWPAAAKPMDQGWPTPGRYKIPLSRSLTWDVEVGERIRRWDWGNGNERIPKVVNVKEFPLPASCWLNEARLPEAALLTAVGTNLHPRAGPGGDARDETERFLYYDGLVPTPDYLRCERVDAASVTLHNRAKFDMTRLFVVDRRARDTVGFAFVDGVKQPFKAGTRLTIEPKRIAAKDWPAAGITQVRQALLDAGLFDAEADSLLKIWHKGLFEQGGVTAFHILPQKEYDRMLPLQIEGGYKPVRVGIALHPHLEIEPALTERVGTLLRHLDSAEFPKRSAASKELLEVGPLAVAMLEAELKKGVTPEKRRRIEGVLQSVDAMHWLNRRETAEKATNQEKNRERNEQTPRKRD